MATDKVFIVRKDRVDRSKVGEPIKRGPTHRVNAHDLTWCGRKIRGLATWNREGSPEDVDCSRCKSAIAANRPRPWRR